MTSILPRDVAGRYRNDRPFTGKPMSFAVAQKATVDGMATSSGRLISAMKRVYDSAQETADAFDEFLPESMDGCWYCAYCRSANHPDALYCGEIIDGRGVSHCGAPKPEEAFELPGDLAGIEDMPRGVGVKVEVRPSIAGVLPLLDTDEYWFSVQAIMYATGKEIHEVATALNMAIITRSAVILDNIGISISRRQMKTPQGILAGVYDAALDLDTFNGRLQPFVARYRAQMRRDRR